MVRSSRSESRYSLPVCGPVMGASVLGFAPGLPTASLSPFAAVLMSPSIYICSAIELPSGIRPLMKRYPADVQQARRGFLVGPIPRAAARSHHRGGNLLGDGAQAGQEMVAHLVARRSR